MHIQLLCRHTTTIDIVPPSIRNQEQPTSFIQKSKSIYDQEYRKRSIPETLQVNDNCIYAQRDSFCSVTDIDMRNFMRTAESNDFAVRIVDDNVIKLRPLIDNAISEILYRTGKRVKYYKKSSLYIARIDETHLSLIKVYRNQELGTIALTPHEHKIPKNTFRILSEDMPESIPLTKSFESLLNSLDTDRSSMTKTIQQVIKPWNDYIDYMVKNFANSDRVIPCKIQFCNNENLLLTCKNNADRRTLLDDLAKKNCTLSAADKTGIKICDFERYKDDFIKITIKPEYNPMLAYEDCTKIIKGSVNVVDNGTEVLLKRFTENLKTLCEQDNIQSLKVAAWLSDIRNARFLTTETKFEEKDVKGSNLNSAQKQAVCNILNTIDISFILGPPGTGKTTVIAKAIEMLAKSGQTVLLSSQSNDAIDNALSRMTPSLDLRPIRLKYKKNNSCSIDELDSFSPTKLLWNMSNSIPSTIKSAIDMRERYITEQDEGHCFSIYHDINVKENICAALRHIRANLDKCDFYALRNRYNWNDKIAYTKSNLAIRLYRQKETGEPEIVNMHKYNSWLKAIKSKTIVEKLLREFKENKTEELDDIKAFYACADNSGTYINDITRTANVFGITCNSNIRRLVNQVVNGNSSDKNDFIFDIAIIDEVSKATLPELLGAVLRANRVVLVGDHRQLAPVFKSPADSNRKRRDKRTTIAEQQAINEMNYYFKELISNTVFKIMYDKADYHIKTMLRQQYRMHNEISDYVISKFYQDSKGETLLQNGLELKDADSSKAHCAYIYDTYNNPIITPDHHIYWVDSTPDSSHQRNCNYFDAQEGTSSYNKYEIDIIKKIVDDIDKSVEKGTSVGVISFYSAQKRHLCSALKPSLYKNIDIVTNTVDSFQGQEKNIIIVSLVKSQPKNRIKKNNPFFKAFERLNVAFSRAQTLLIIVGSVSFCSVQNISITSMSKDSENEQNEDGSDTVLNTPVYKEIIDKLDSIGCLIKGYNLLKS